MTYWEPDGPFHVIAHRGASAYASDNSVEAFELALSCSATDIETDLHSTADGELVIRHDASLNSDPPAYVSELTFNQYRDICEQNEQPCIRLHQVIDLAQSLGLGLYLDIKQVSPRALLGLFETVHASRCRDQIVLASFRADIIREIKQQAPHLRTSVLFRDPNMDLRSLAEWTQCDLLHPCFDVFDDPLRHFTESWVQRVRGFCSGIIAWNITSPAVAEHVVQMGIQGACADDPRLLRDALKKFEATNV